MGWITELLGSENAKPVWGKIATSLDYVIGDLGTVIRTAAIVGCIYLAVAYTKLVNNVNSDYITPREHGAVLGELNRERLKNDSLTKLLNEREALFTAQSFKFIDIVKVKDSTIQEKDFIIKGYVDAIKKTIK